MEIIFLGTAQAVPTERRNHTAILVKRGSETILVDCGEATQRQFRKARLNPCKLTRILITHWHGDHILGLPGLFQTLALSQYKKTLHVYGPPGTKRYIEHLLKMFIFEEKLSLAVHEIAKEGTFYEDGFILEAYKMAHKAPCLAYSLTEKPVRKVNLTALKKAGVPLGPLVGRLQRGKSVTVRGKTVRPEDVTYIQPGKKVAFILDTVLVPACFKVAENADLLICEGTYSAELSEKAAEYKHLTASQAAEIALKAGAKKLFLLHLSQRYEKEPEKILLEAKSVFADTYLAEDFLTLTL